MNTCCQRDVVTHILKEARSLGASLAGVTTTTALLDAPSYRVYGQIELPPEARSVLVLALVHSEAEPELDWWGVEGGTPGNHMLITISQHLKQWLTEEHNVYARPISYHIEKGGIFLKDAAVLAGLGVIGANNLLITPEFGPRVRLRAMFLDIELEPTGPLTFSPCDACDMPCRRSCPQNAFASRSYSGDACVKQMQADEKKAAVEKVIEDDSVAVRVPYCRNCELACPVGKGL